MNWSPPVSIVSLNIAFGASLYMAFICFSSENHCPVYLMVQSNHLQTKYFVKKLQKYFKNGF